MDEVELEVVLIDQREWYVCPVRGERCGRVLVSLGSMGLDALDWHVRSAHRLALPIHQASVCAEGAKPSALAASEKGASG
ncbi:hypothetical protein GCM10027597_15810 [Saccharopolyspora tripterygii]